MESDSDSSGEDHSVERSTIFPTELEPRDLYLLRPLPTLIGSATFYETEHLGLRLADSSDSEYGSEVSESEGESSGGTETEVRMRKKPADRTTAGGLAEDSGGSSGDLFSEDDTTAVTGNVVRRENGTSLIEEPISKKMKGKFTNGNSSDGGLFGSSSDGEDLFSEEPKKEKKVVERTERQTSEETIEPVSSPAPASKKKKTKKRPPGAVPVFGILDSDSDGDEDSNELTRSDNRAPSSRSAVSATSSKVKVDHGLFGGDSDSEGDLFSPEVPKEKKKEVPKQNDTQTKEPTNNVRTLFGGGERNFSVSDSDEDLFEASTTSKKTEERTVVKKPIGGVQLFAGISQAALLGNKVNQDSDREQTNSPITISKKKETKQSTISLYDDSSPDDDLFSSSSKLSDKPNNVKTEQKIKTETEVNRPTPVTVKSGLSNGLDMFDSSGDDSGDDLFSSSVSSKITVSEVKQPAVVKVDSPLSVNKSVAEPVNNYTEDKQDHNTHNSLGREPVNTPDLKSKTSKPPGGLFPQLDSDSDEDDLFSILNTKRNTNKQPPPVSESTIPVSTSKTPVSTPTDIVFESKPPVSEPTLPVSNKGGDLFSENDDLFSTIPATPDTSLAPTTAHPPPSNKQKTAPSLFSGIDLGDQDDEGLFDSPASLDLFVAPSPATTLTAPAAKPKPTKAKTTLPTLFGPIDIDTDEGGLFDQTSPVKKPLPPAKQDTQELPPQPPTMLPSLTSSRPKNPGRRPPSQKTRQERAEKSGYEDLLAPPTAPEPVEQVVQSVQRPTKKLSGPAGNIDFLKELNKAVGKGHAPGGSPTKRKPVQKTEVLFEDEGDLFSKPAPPKEGVRGAEVGASPLDGFYTEEEPSKLLGVARGRPRAPGKRLPTRSSRTQNISTPSDDFGSFFTDPSETPTPAQTGDSLFNGDLGDGLFTLPESRTGGDRENIPTNALGDDHLFSDINNTSKQVSSSREDDLFARAKPEDNSAVLGASKKHVTNPPDDAEDLFVSVALPKPTKTSKPVNKERHTASPVVPQVQDPAITQTLDNNREGAEALPASVDKSKKYKVVKRTDNELFGGEDDLFGPLSESKTRSDKSRKKKATDASKKPKKPKKEIDSATMDLFD